MVLYAGVGRRCPRPFPAASRPEGKRPGGIPVFKNIDFSKIIANFQLSVLKEKKTLYKAENIEEKCKEWT